MRHSFTILCLLINMITQAQDNTWFRAKFISNEVDSVTGVCTTKVRIKFDTTITFATEPTYKVPQTWKAAKIKSLLGKTYYKGDSIEYSFKITYPVSAIPFFPQEIKIVFTLPNGEVYAAVAMVYFTPYNTVELWNINDFFALNRQWLFRQGNPNIDTTRVTMKKSVLPKSNFDINDTTQWKGEQYDDNFQYQKVQGLAYYIPMRPVLKSQLDSLRSIGDGGADKVKVTYTGKITGWINSITSSDLGLFGLPRYITLEGIEVKLMEKDKWGDDYIQTTYTKADGSFEFNYTTEQQNENGALELYFKVSSCNQSYNVGAYSPLTINHVNKIPFSYIYHKERPIIVQNNADERNIILPTDLSSVYASLRAVHWIVRAYRYFDVNNIKLDKGLYINVNFDGTSHYWDTPSHIDLRVTADENEYVLQHEFGHFVFYELQFVNYLTCIPWMENGTHSWLTENTSRNAWNEGWAAAVAMILDAAYYQEDEEYALRRRNIQHIPIFEKRQYHVNNGFRSEYYLACAIYDLWDGANKGLPTSMIETDTSRNYHSWNDIIDTLPSRKDVSDWRYGRDSVEMSLYEICRPLWEEDICVPSDYYTALCRNATIKKDYELRANISRVFRENRVVLDVRAYNNNIDVANFASDAIGIEMLIFETHNLHPDVDAFVNLHNIGLNPFNQEFHLLAYPNQDYAITDHLWLGISNGTTYNLYLNDRIESNGNINNNTNGIYNIHGLTGIEVRNGLFQLGGSSTTAQLNINNRSFVEVQKQGRLVINNNSKLVVKAGGSLIIRKDGQLNISGCGNIIVEPGGYICLESGAKINLVDNCSNICANTYKPYISPAVSPYIAAGACISEISDISQLAFSGLGTIASSKTNAVLLQDNITTDQSLQAGSIKAQNMKIYNSGNNQTDVNLFSGDVILGNNFEVSLGSTLTVENKLVCPNQ